MLDTDTEEALSPYSVSVFLHIYWKLADKDRWRFRGEVISLMRRFKYLHDK